MSAQAVALSNPLRDAFDQYSEHCAYAIPTDEAIQAIAALGPLVEVGAGTGYWAWMLEQAGAVVRPFDAEPEGNHYVSETQWVRVYPGDHRVLPEFARWHGSRHALLLCWPPYDSDMALECLRVFRGDAVAYVGEYQGGCCATDAFFAYLDAEWERVREIGLPQWPGIYDYLSIWRRD